MDSKLRPETLCIQAGYTPKNGEPRQIPIVQSTTFKYDTSEDMGKLFDLEAERLFLLPACQNPTCDAVAAKICGAGGRHRRHAHRLRPGGQLLWPCSTSPAAATTSSASSTIYGGTFNLFSVTMKRMGIDFTFVDPDCTEEELDAAFRPNTKAVFGETIANPALTVLDIEKFAKAAHAHGVPLIVDNTFATPINCQPFRVGRGHRHPLHHQVHGRPRRRCGRLPSWTAASSTGRPTRTSSPACAPPTRATTASPTPSASAWAAPSSPSAPPS